MRNAEKLGREAKKSTVLFNVDQVVRQPRKLSGNAQCSGGFGQPITMAGLEVLDCIFGHFFRGITRRVTKRRMVSASRSEVLTYPQEVRQLNAVSRGHSMKAGQNSLHTGGRKRLRCFSQRLPNRPRICEIFEVNRAPRLHNTNNSSELYREAVELCTTVRENYGLFASLLLLHLSFSSRSIIPLHLMCHRGQAICLIPEHKYRYCRRTCEQHCKEGNCECADGSTDSPSLPPNHAPIRSEIHARAESVNQAHSIIPLWTDSHLATDVDSGASRLTLANVKPPRETRTQLPTEADHA